MTERAIAESQARKLFHVTNDALATALRRPLDNEAEIAELNFISDELRELIAQPNDKARIVALAAYSKATAGARERAR